MNTPPVQTSVPASTAPSSQLRASPRRGFRLYKRFDDGREMPPEAPGYKDRYYYFRFAFRGIRYKRCLEVTDAETAQKYARAKFKEIREAILRGDHARLAGTSLRATPAGTIAQLLKAYHTSPVDAEASTRRQNELALRQLLRVALSAPGQLPAASSPLPAASDAPELSLRITDIDSTVARRWFEQASTRALEAADQSTKASIKRTANSRYVQARSVFAPKALATYKDAGLYHEGFETFLSAGEIFRFKKLPATSFNPPADTVIKATLDAWQTIDDRNLFLAIGHELAFGLRVEELAAATWSWWTTREGYPVLDGCTDVKNGTGLVQVRALDPWFSALRARIQAKGWEGKKEEHILTGTPTNRCDGIPRAVSAWLRALGWTTQKTNHELRKYAGSQVAMRYGIYDAQCWLRHSTVKVTEQHYSGYVRKFKPANTDNITARWATLETIPHLHILEA